MGGMPPPPGVLDRVAGGVQDAPVVMGTDCRLSHHPLSEGRTVKGLHWRGGGLLWRGGGLLWRGGWLLWREDC